MVFQAYVKCYKEPACFPLAFLLTWRSRSENDNVGYENISKGWETYCFLYTKTGEEINTPKK